MGMSDAFKKKTNTYKVNSDGKAPSGLKTGDTVVTGGGTYKITGVNSDGSYQSTKVNNTTTSTYTGSYSDAPSSSTGGSSGGSTSSKNSPTSTSNYTYKNDYSSTGGDMGLYGQQLMQGGASAADILAVINDRQYKALNTEGLSQYANDPLQNAMWAYYESALKKEAMQSANEYMENWNNYYTEEKPTYNSTYDPAIDNLLNQILNREDFSYDAANDPLYQQYSAMYQQEGDRAMRETLAEAAASAGGMNSYAITAAQQANNYYNSQLTNKIPELYQLAYEMYLQDKASMVEDLGLLQGMDDRQYNRYRDTMQDFYNDKNFAYGTYQDAVTQGNWQQNFDYNSAIDNRDYNYTVSQGNLANSWKEKEWDNDMYLQGVEQNRYDEGIAREDAAKVKEQAREEAYALLELGQMPPAALLEAAGIDTSYASAYIKGIQAELARKSSSGSGGGGGGYTGDKVASDDKKKEGDTGYTGDKKVVTNTDVTQHPDYNNGTLEGLGLGPVSDELINELAMYGALDEDNKGGVVWANGWNVNNYAEKLSFARKMGYGPMLSGLFSINN